MLVEKSDHPTVGNAGGTKGEEIANRRPCQLTFTFANSPPREQNGQKIGRTRGDGQSAAYNEDQRVNRSDRPVIESGPGSMTV